MLCIDEVNAHGGNMRYSNERLNDIYDRTNGRCHICSKKLAFKNYGSLEGLRGAWEVEHSNPKSKGGTDRLSNLYAACISCNRSKGANSTKSARKRNGRTAAPLSAEKIRARRADNAVVGGIIGGLAGLLGGPIGVAIGAGIGAAIGHDQEET